MAFLTLPEVARVWLLRPDVLSDLLWIMAEFERQTGRKSYVPSDGGVRTRARQIQLKADSLAAGRGQLAYRVADAEKSRHPLGAAFHLYIVGAKSFSDPDYAVLDALAKSRGYLAGSEFSGQPDDGHFEKHESLAVARAKWDGLTRERLWRVALTLAVGAALALTYLTLKKATSHAR